jgi:glucosamine-6-phosphate deaminase
MLVILSPDYDTLSKRAAHIVANSIQSKPNAVLGLATGNTPLGLYRELARLHREEGLDFSRITTFSLDEYLGLPASHPQSYHNTSKIIL